MTYVFAEFQRTILMNEKLCLFKIEGCSLCNGSKVSYCFINDDHYNYTVFENVGSLFAMSINYPFYF